MGEMRWDAPEGWERGSGSNMRLWLPKIMIMIYLFHKTSNVTKKKKYQAMVVKMRERSKTLISSVAQSCPTFCDPMDCSTPGVPIHH